MLGHPNTEEVFDHALTGQNHLYIDDSLEDSGVVHNEDPVKFRRPRG